MFLYSPVKFSVAGLTLCNLAAGQYFPPCPEGVTSIPSRLYPGVSLSYKETRICETTPGVKSFAGYVHLPYQSVNDSAQDYQSNVFFWYFQSRNSPETAPVAIYLGGGPGETSLYGATSEGGPCYIGSDSNSTYLNEWSWNNDVNMLYVDQPNQVGFSYDTLHNSTLDFLTGEIKRVDFSKGLPLQPNETVTFGTFPSQDPLHTANNSVNAARALWSFAQVWFDEFPKITAQNNKLSIWANSYGGYYAPAAMAYFEQQVRKIPTASRRFTLDTLGLTNGCVDGVIQGLSWPSIAYNNTYDFPIISKDGYEKGVQAMLGPGGCQDLAFACRDLAAVGDPDDIGNNVTVNKACFEAGEVCFGKVTLGSVQDSNYSAFDFTQRLPDPYPSYYPTGFFNQHWVQQALGTPVNFTDTSNVVANSILSTGDLVRQSIGELDYILQSGIKVALMYGDRDQRCNWVGVENVTLLADYPNSAKFRSSGYASTVTNQSYTGGLVRQYGNFSFSRVFEAGHDPAAYQPETAFRIFNRAMFDTDVATGDESTAGDSSYATKGPLSSWHIKNKVPPSLPTLCYVRDVVSCSERQISALEAGTAVVRDFVVVEPAS